MTILSRRVAIAKPQWWRAARWPLLAQGYLALWFWAIVLLLWVVAILVISQVGTVRLSFFQFAQHGALWFPFSVSIMMAITVPTHIANGMTRRSFARGTLVAAAIVAVGYGFAIAVGLAAEGALYDAIGAPHVHVAEAADGGSVGVVGAPWEAGFLSSLLAYAGRTAGGLMAGLLVGISYYRYGGWKGTFVLPLTLLPALVSQADLARLLAWGFEISLPAQTLITFTVAILAAVAYYRIIRTIPIAQNWSIHGQ